MLQKLVGGVEDEPGTLVYILHHDAADENVVWFYERYDSQESFDAHGKSDVMKAVGPDPAPFMAGRPELTFLNVIGGKGL